MKLEYFDIETLEKLFKAHQKGGPRNAYKECYGLRSDAVISTNDVEDFIVVFYKEYNKVFGLTF